MQHIKDGEADPHDQQILIGCLPRLQNPGRTAGKESRPDLMAEEDHGRADHKRCARADQHRRFIACADPVPSPRSVILPGIGHHGIPVSDPGPFQRSVKLIGGRIAGDKGDPEAVYHVDHDHSADGNQNVLQDKRRAETKQLPVQPGFLITVSRAVMRRFARVCPCRGPTAGFLRLPCLKPARPEFLHRKHRSQAPEAGEQLGHDRCGGGAGNAQAENHDEDKVHADIEQGGRRHRLQGRPAVPQRPQHGGRKIEQHLCRHTQKEDDGVGPRHGPDPFRHLKKIQDRRNREQCAQRKQQPQSRGQKHGLPVSSFQSLPVTCAEALGNQNGKTLGNSLDRSENQIKVPVDTAQGSQRVHADAPADNQGIRDGVELLEQISQHERDGKGENQPCRASLRHIFYILQIKPSVSHRCRGKQSSHFGPRQVTIIRRPPGS